MQMTFLTHTPRYDSAQTSFNFRKFDFGRFKRIPFRQEYSTSVNHRFGSVCFSVCSFSHSFMGGRSR